MSRALGRGARAALLLLVVGAGRVGAVPTPDPDPLSWSAVVPAPVEAVWAAWATRAGLQGWLAPRVELELRPLGRLDVLFFPDEPAGRRGAEDNRILAVQEGRLLSFTWDAPPHLPEARAQRTVVTVRLEPAGEARTLVRLDHDGWGSGGEWDRARAYFDEAWPTVLARLVRRFEEGPVDWSAPPPSRPHPAVTARHRPGPENPRPPGFRLGHLAVFRAGPGADTLPPERLRELMGRHGAALGALMARGRIPVAGPLGRSAPELGGASALALVPDDDAERVRALLATDPALEAGVLTVELVPWWIPPG